jgi:hypothetical protein
MGRVGVTREAVQQGRGALEAKRRAHEQTRNHAVTALHIEAATLAERAAHVDELRQVLRSLRDSKSRAGETGRPSRKDRGRTSSDTGGESSGPSAAADRRFAVSNSA